MLIVQWQGLYANVLYYFNKFDIFSNQYNGNNKYKLIFKNGQLPPVDGFLVENIYNRYNVGTASNLSQIQIIGYHYQKKMGIFY